MDDQKGSATLKISVITATYNSELVLKNCLDSVSSQLHDDIEHIVIDGMSTDDTVKLLDSHKDQLATVISEFDEGIYDAMNKGIKLAKGDIIGFLNSDDIYANNLVLSKVSDIFEKDPLLDSCYADLIYTSYYNTSRTIRYWKSCEFTKGLFAKGWCPPHPTFFVRRSVYNRFDNFNLRYNIASDVDLMMRFLELYEISSRYIPEVWVKMRIGGSSNKSLKNILSQNKQILHALKSNGLKVNTKMFFLHKFLSRFKQFFKRP